MLEQFLSPEQYEMLATAFNIFLATSPLWLPVLLFIIFFNIWIKFVRTKAVLKDGGILLEIKLPRDVFKSPLAMEIIIMSLYQTGGSNYIDTFLKGKHRPWFTFEIISVEGQIRFFMWTKPKFRQLIESQFYAQYPGVEIYEAEDYSKDVHLDPEKVSLWGLHFKLAKDDIYPIKTYIDYGLDKPQEEENKIDPMTSTLEFLGSLKAGEQVWIQILFQAHRKTNFKDDAKFAKPDWKPAGEAKIKELIEKYTLDKEGKFHQPTEGAKEIITALERSLTKIPFDVGIRGFYIARPEAFDSIAITGLIGAFRQYSSETLNGFKIAKFTDFDYPWQDFRRMRRTHLEEELLNAYKLRSFFQLPYEHLFTHPFVLTTEELATIFHLPGRVLGTPTVTKIPSKKSEAPSNLPT